MSAEFSHFMLYNYFLHLTLFSRIFVLSEKKLSNVTRLDDKYQLVGKTFLIKCREFILSFINARDCSNGILVPVEPQSFLENIFEDFQSTDRIHINDDIINKSQLMTRSGV